MRAHTSITHNPTHERRATFASSAYHLRHLCITTYALRLTRCALSLGTLTDPAKGARCAHLPQCNYETLRELLIEAAQE